MLLKNIRFPFSVNSLKNGFRFENQSLTWTFGEFETHSNSFAYGLLDQGWKAGDKLLMLLGRSNTSEAAAAFVGASKAGVISVPFRAESAAEIEEAINTVNPKGIVFSPNQQIEGKKFIEVLQGIVPESLTTSSGEVLKTRFSNLQWLIHTGFYSYPGTYKFRECLCYASKNFNRLSLSSTSGPITALLEQNNLKLLTASDLSRYSEKVAKSKNVIIAGDPLNVSNFGIVLGGLQHGYLTVFTGNDKSFTKILKYYQDYSLIVEDKLVENANEINLENEGQLQNLLTSGNVREVERVFHKQAIQI